jgi:hypothetical protein
MNVSDSVTFLFTDDNFGNLLRVPLANETNREGGSGICYHFGYVGPPRDYEWINTMQLVKSWEQMHLGYHRNAKQIWIANVQDLKPYVSSLESIWSCHVEMSADRDCMSCR